MYFLKYNIKFNSYMLSYYYDISTSMFQSTDIESGYTLYTALTILPVYFLLNIYHIILYSLIT